MNKTELAQRIKAIKKELAGLGDLRPVSLSKQRRGDKGAYLYLSYTYRGKGHTEYVPVERKAAVEEQIANYKRLRELTQEWIDLSLQLCAMKDEEEKKKTSP